MWNKGGPRFVRSMFFAALVLTVLWTMGYGVYMAFVHLGPWMGGAAIVSAILFVILTFAFMEE